LRRASDANASAAPTRTREQRFDGDAKKGINGWQAMTNCGGGKFFVWCAKQPMDNADAE